MFSTKDYVGSVRAVLNSDGQVVESYNFYPFGLKMPQHTYIYDQGSDKNLFTGKELDAESGDYYFGFRYYNPAIGKWNSVDALADFYKTQGVYNYCLNCPMNYIDPFGLGNNPTKIPRYPMSNSEVYSNGHEYYIDGVQVSRDFLNSFLPLLPGGGGGFHMKIEGHYKYGGDKPLGYFEWTGGAAGTRYGDPWIPDTYIYLPYEEVGLGTGDRSRTSNERSLNNARLGVNLLYFCVHKNIAALGSG